MGNGGGGAGRSADLSARAVGSLRGGEGGVRRRRGGRFEGLGAATKVKCSPLCR